MVLVETRKTKHVVSKKNTNPVDRIRLLTDFQATAVQKVQMSILQAVLFLQGKKLQQECSISNYADVTKPTPT